VQVEQGVRMSELDKEIVMVGGVT